MPILQEDACFSVVPYAPGLETPEPVFFSVESMLNTLYAWYDEGALTVDAYGRVNEEADYRRYLEVVVRENPCLTSWAESLALYPRRY